MVGWEVVGERRLLISRMKKREGVRARGSGSPRKSGSGIAKGNKT